MKNIIQKIFSSIIILSLMILCVPFASANNLGGAFGPLDVFRKVGNDLVPRNPDWNLKVDNFQLNSTTSDGYIMMSDDDGVARWDTIFNYVIFVKNEGATPIQDVLDSITDASFTKRYTLILDAGYYDETINVKPFIDISGTGINWNATIKRANVYWTAAELEVGAIKHVQIETLDVNFQNASYVKGLQLDDVLLYDTAFTGIGQNNNESGGHIISLIDCVVYGDEDGGGAVFNGGLFVDSTGGFWARGATFNSDTVFQSNNSVLQRTYTLSGTAQAFIRSGAIGAFPLANQSVFIAPSGTILNIDGLTASTADLDQVATDALQLQDMISSGSISPKFIITDNPDGTIDITDFDISLYNNSNQVGKPRRYEISGVDDQPLATSSPNFILVDYNSGSPQLRFETSDISNESDIELIAYRYRRDSELHGYELNTEGEGLADKINERLKDENYFDRANGLILGEVATRIITITQGKGYIGATPISLEAFNSSTNTLDFYYHSGGVYTYSTTTQYVNSQYDDGTNLQTLLPNKYVNNFIFRDLDVLDSHSFFILGKQYNTVALALEEGIPADLPDIISENGIYVGRIIVGTGDNIASLITSAFEQAETVAGATNHNNLSGLQGGIIDEYYHLSSAEHTEATQYATSTLNGLLTSADWTIFNNKIANLVEDTTPQLGGDLASNGFDILMADSDKAIFGTGSDLEIYSDGEDVIFRQLTQDKYIRFFANLGGTDTEVLTINGIVNQPRVGVNVPAPDGTFHIARTSGNTAFVADNYSNTSDNRNAFNFRRFGGTQASPSAVGSGYKIFQINSNAYDGSDNVTVSQISSEVDTYTGLGDISGIISFSTRDDGGGLTENFSIEKDGGIYAYNLLGGAIGANPQVWYNATTKELAYDTSALKYKENIRDLTNTDWIYQLRTVLFDEKEGERNDMMGLIAEEVEQVKPELVFYKPDKKIILNEEGDEIEVDDLENMELEGVAYTSLIPALLKEIQNQKIIIDNLTSRIEILEGI